SISTAMSEQFPNAVKPFQTNKTKSINVLFISIYAVQFDKDTEKSIILQKNLCLDALKRRFSRYYFNV
ncbi:MAG: hypothetical protein K6F85_05770, partial [Bacteroidales bacterium]|nr:hypothetical protein [Bacteroidales bacterium]